MEKQTKYNYKLEEYLNHENYKMVKLRLEKEYLLVAEIFYEKGAANFILDMWCLGLELEYLFRIINKHLEIHKIKYSDLSFGTNYARMIQRKYLNDLFL